MGFRDSDTAETIRKVLLIVVRILLALFTFFICLSFLLSKAPGISENGFIAKTGGNIILSIKDNVTSFCNWVVRNPSSFFAYFKGEEHTNYIINQTLISLCISGGLVFMLTSIVGLVILGLACACFLIVHFGLCIASHFYTTSSGVLPFFNFSELFNRIQHNPNGIIKNIKITPENFLWIYLATITCISLVYILVRGLVQHDDKSINDAKVLKKMKADERLGVEAIKKMKNPKDFGKINVSVEDLRVVDILSEENPFDLFFKNQDPDAEFKDSKEIVAVKRQNF